MIFSKFSKAQLKNISQKGPHHICSCCASVLHSHRLCYDQSYHYKQSNLGFGGPGAAGSCSFSLSSNLASCVFAFMKCKFFPINTTREAFWTTFSKSMLMDTRPDWRRGETIIILSDLTSKLQRHPSKNVTFTKNKWTSAHAEVLSFSWLKQFFTY